MKLSAITLGFAAFAAAAPTADLAKRQSANIDGTVLNFALTLEHLENAFYRQNLRRFGDSFPPRSRFGANIRQAGVHEAQHVGILTRALRAQGVTPVRECTYNFGSLTPESFLALASVIEGVGVSAYAGAARLITNRQFVDQAAAILSVEARHNAVFRTALDQTGMPQTLDTALTPNQVFSIVAPFIVRCPAGNPTLPFRAFPRLTLRGPNVTYSRGAQVAVTLGPRAPIQGEMFCAFALTTGNIFSRAFRDGGARQFRCVIPKGEFGPMGQTYMFIVRAQGNLADSNVIAGPLIINVAAPFFVGTS